MRAAALASVLALAGCASTQQLAQEDQMTCAGWHMGPGTEQFFQCMKLLTELRGIENEARSLQVQSVGRGLQGFSQGYNAAAPTRPATVTCRTVPSGTSTIYTPYAAGATTTCD